MDQKLYHSAVIHNIEKAVWFSEKEQTFFQSVQTPQFRCSSPHPSNFLLWTQKVQYFLDLFWTADLYRMLFLPVRGVPCLWGGLQGTGGLQCFPLSCAGAGCFLPDLPAPAFRRRKSACPLITLLPLSSGQALKSAGLNCCQQWHFLPWPGLEKRSKYKPEPWVT